MNPSANDILLIHAFSDRQCGVAHPHERVLNDSLTLLDQVRTAFVSYAFFVRQCGVAHPCERTLKYSFTLLDQVRTASALRGAGSWERWKMLSTVILGAGFWWFSMRLPS